MRQKNGFTLIELLIVLMIIGMLAALAVPGLLRSRIAANESSAVASLRAIGSAEITFAASCGRGGYAQSLLDLARPQPGGVGFVGPDLAADPALKSGYEIVLAAEAGAGDVAPAGSTCNGSAMNSVAQFWVGAKPRQVGMTGQRTFGLDTRGALYQHPDGSVFLPNPVPAGTAVLQ